MRAFFLAVVALPQLEQPTLNLGDFYWRRTFFVVVSYVIDPTAHGKAPHLPSIERLQQFGRRSHVLHSGVEPKVVAVWIEDDWHAVVNG